MFRNETLLHGARSPRTCCSHSRAASSPTVSATLAIAAFHLPSAYSPDRNGLRMRYETCRASSCDKNESVPPGGTTTANSLSARSYMFSLFRHSRLVRPSRRAQRRGGVCAILAASHLKQTVQKGFVKSRSHPELEEA